MTDSTVSFDLRAHTNLELNLGSFVESALGRVRTPLEDLWVKDCFNRCIFC